MFRKILSQVPGLKPPRAGKFFYPRRGYGQLSECLAEAAQKAGTEIVFGARVTSIERQGNSITAVRYQKEGKEHVLQTQHVWSTLPVTLLVRLMRPEAPPNVLEAANSLSYRGMVLVYLVLEQDRPSGFDAYYVPEKSMPVSRMSEPKNFFGSEEPHGTTVLCAELPCDPDGLYWELTDAELSKKLCEWLEDAGLPVCAPIKRVYTRRVRRASPGLSKRVRRTSGANGSMAPRTRWAPPLRPTGVVCARQHSPRHIHGVCGGGLFRGGRNV